MPSPYQPPRRKLLCKRCVLQCLRIFCRCRKAIQFTTPLGIKHPGCSHRTWCTTSFYSGSLRLSRQQLLQSKLGLLNGKRVNARVRSYHEPITMLNYTFDINDRSQLNVATSVRFGQNGYSALTWYGGPDPRPDYYRYLPSFYNNTYVGAQLYEAWIGNTNNIRHINWDNLYHINQSQEENPTYGAGHRAINMIEERHADQIDWNLYTQFSHIFRDNSKINGGLNLRRNRTEYYSEVKDLLGGDYWVDVDKFAERDMGGMNQSFTRTTWSTMISTVMPKLSRRVINTATTTTEILSTHAPGHNIAETSATLESIWVENSDILLCGVMVFGKKGCSLTILKETLRSRIT